MHIDYLIGMANDIGAFFTGVDAEDVAAANIHAHIKRYWDPRMRAQIIAHYNETGGADLAGRGAARDRAARGRSGEEEADLTVAARRHVTRISTSRRRCS